MKKRLFFSNRLYPFLCLTILFVGCEAMSKAKNDKQLQEQEADDSYTIGDTHYNIDEPFKYTLSKELVEISALSMNDDFTSLYAVNDEKALIYVLDLSGNITNEYDFGKNGDYEGIEVIGDLVYILKSNGKVTVYDWKKGEVEILDNALTSANDTEGLAFDKDKELLLIACKGTASIDHQKKMKKTKAIYAIDLKNNKLIETPYQTISDKQLESFFNYNSQSKKLSTEEEKMLKRVLSFSPSAIAKNPIDGNLYLLSTVGKTMVVLNGQGVIQQMSFLNHKDYIQPEGICFDGKGTMYISNEGKGGEANILKIVRN